MNRPTSGRLFLLLIAALGVGLVGCDGATEPPPPPPPPPPPSPAEVTITSVVDPETGSELAQGENGFAVSGRIGVAIDFDAGGSQAQSLDLIFEHASGATEVVPCDVSAAQGARGLRAAVQDVLCVVDTAEGRGPCQGQAMSARFGNGVYTLEAELRLADGTTASDQEETPLAFDNGEATGGMALEIGPRVVSVGGEFPEFGTLDGVPFWGGPRDLSWTACPVIFSPELTDICRIEISGGTLDGTGDLDLGNGPGQRASSEVPFTYTALYRSDTGEPVNEDLVEDDPAGGGHVIGDGPSGFKVLLCDGTDVTEFFDIQSDVRHLDMTAPQCDPGSCEPEIAAMTVLQNGLYSGGAFSLGGLTDGGVGGIYGQTAIVDAYEWDSGDPDAQEVFLANPVGIADLPEDDGCGSDETTDAGLQFGCGGTDAGLPVDAYFLVVVEVADLLGNALGDGDMDRTIADEFSDSAEFGVDRTEPSLDEVQPPGESPPFVWNPDLGFDGTPGSRACPSLDAVNDCESVMWESVDPELASGDVGSGTEDGSCGVECDDDDGDGNRIDLEIDDSPGDALNGDSPITNDAGLAAGMFQSFFCGGAVNDGAECDGSDDGTYTVTITSSDKAVKENNVHAFQYSFVLDVSPPVVAFGGITGLNSSNAASVEFVLDGSVVDRNGDGTAVTLATVQVTIDGGDGICDGTGGGDDFISAAGVLVTPNDDASGNTVTVDVTDQVNTDGGDFEVTFTAQNQGGNLGAGSYDYCFILTGDDGAARKDGTDDGVDSVSDAQKSFTWQ